MSESAVPAPESPKKRFQFGQKEKTILSVVVGLIAIGLTVNSSIQYEAHNNTEVPTTHPPPTYTGSAPLAVNDVQEARNSNNDLILVVTPCRDDTLNSAITEITVLAGNKIRTTDGIYVGVFTLPKNAELEYPTVFLRLMNKGASSLYQITLRSDVTLDKIYDNYLSRKFLRD